MSLKNAFQKAAGLFVEIPESQDSSSIDFSSVDSTPTPAPTPAAPRTVEQVVRQSPGPNLDEIQVPATPAKQLIGLDGTPDFAAIFEQAGVPKVPFGAEEALSVIGSLPADLPIDIKRKTVGATLSAMGKAMGVTTDSVVADASRKIAALHSFSEMKTSQTNEFQAAVDKRVADLKDQIAQIEKQAAQAKENLAKVVGLCEEEGGRLDDVLEFFTLDLPPSRHA